MNPINYVQSKIPRHRGRYLVIDHARLVEPEELQALYPEGQAVLFTGHLAFRRAYEPLRDRYDAGEEPLVIVITSTEQGFPADYQRRADGVIEVRPSLLLGQTVHPIVDHLILDRHTFQEIARRLQADPRKHNAEETRLLALEAVLEMPLPTEPAEAIPFVLALRERWSTLPELLRETAQGRLSAQGIESNILIDEVAFQAWIIRLLEADLRALLERGEERAERRLTSLEAQAGRLEASLNVIALADSLRTAARLVEKLPAVPFPKLRERLESSVRGRILTNVQAAQAVRERRASYSADLYNLATFTALTSELEKAAPRSAEEWLKVAGSLAETDSSYAMLSNKGPELAAMEKRWREASDRLNAEFARFLATYYPRWMQKPRPLLSADVLPERVIPELEKGHKVFFMIWDGMSLSQWQAIRDYLNGLGHLKEELYFVLLPTATTYARNALFAGRLPREIVARYNSFIYVTNNDNERVLLRDILKEAKTAKIGHSYYRATRLEESDVRNIELDLKTGRQLVAVVTNFVDLLVTAAGKANITFVDMPGFAASKFRNLRLAELIRLALQEGYVVYITSDHGNSPVERSRSIPASALTGGYQWEDRHSRFAVISHKRNPLREDEAIFVPQASDWGLPDLGGAYLLALDRLRFGDMQSDNLNTVAHGGISLWENVVPLARLEA